MPISKSEFVAGEKRDYLEENVLAFLKGNPEKAFTAKEIFEEMQRSGHLVKAKDTEERLHSWMRLTTKIDQLALQTKIQSKTIYSRGNAETYYLNKP